LIRACLKLSAVNSPSFDDILERFTARDFEIVGGAYRETVREYAVGIRDWESSHPSSLSLLNPDSLPVG
jgi:hypothetical protein